MKLDLCSQIMEAEFGIKVSAYWKHRVTWLNTGVVISTSQAVGAILMAGVAAL